MRNAALLLTCLLACLPLAQTQARALGFVPSPEPRHAQFLMGWRTDLWTSPLTDKRSPVRLYDLRAIVPVEKPLEWVVTGRFEIEGLSSGRADLVVGPQHTLIGSDLRMQETGIDVSRRGEDDSWFAFNTSYASASDEPFRNSRDVWAEVETTYAFPSVGDYQWVVSADYSKNRGFLNDRPLPMVGIIYQPVTGFSATFGFPYLRLLWEEEKVWRANFQMTPAGVSFDLTKNLNPSVSQRFRAGVATRSYLHENRIEDDMRLFYQETYADSGYRTKLSERTFIEMLVGASFDRSFYEGKQVYQSTHSRTTLPADFYGRFRLEIVL